MKLREPLLPLVALLLIPLATPAQNPKQELNDQFWEAVRKGDVAAVTALLDKGADVNAKFRYGTTALFKAAERGHVEVVKLLLARGADVSVKDTFYGATAMSWALDNKRFEVVRALLEKDAASVNDVLMTGVREGNVGLVSAAIEKGGLKPETLTAALALATSEQKNAEIIEMLKKAGAVPPPEIDAATLQSYVGQVQGGARAGDRHHTQRRQTLCRSYWAATHRPYGAGQDELQARSLRRHYSDVQCRGWQDHRICAQAGTDYDAAQARRGSVVSSLGLDSTPWSAAAWRRFGPSCCRDLMLIGGYVI